MVPFWRYFCPAGDSRKALKGTILFFIFFFLEEANLKAKNQMRMSPGGRHGVYGRVFMAGCGLAAEFVLTECVRLVKGGWDDFIFRLLLKSWKKNETTSFEL